MPRSNAVVQGRSDGGGSSRAAYIGAGFVGTAPSWLGIDIFGSGSIPVGGLDGADLARCEHRRRDGLRDPTAITVGPDTAGLAAGSHDGPDHS
jgi:hypothetical protein